jgi:hypothetical protein
LDRGNAQPSTLQADFARVGIIFWAEMERNDARVRGWRRFLEELNNWRNAIAHQAFDPDRLGGTTVLQLARVRRWRGVCQRLARLFDEVLRRHLHNLTGTSPW